MNPLNIILTVLLFLSGALTVILVLMHSGKGTGVSDMIASSLYNSGTGSGVLEKNLTPDGHHRDRLHREHSRDGAHVPHGNARLVLLARHRERLSAAAFGSPPFCWRTGGEGTHS